MRRAGWICLLSVLAGGCEVAGGGPDGEEIEIALEPIPPFGQPGTFDVATWNLEWFGSSHEGPSDEARQLAGARAVISGLDLDLWGVEEVVSASQFEELLAGLPYQGLLANDPSVDGGDDFYGAGEQKVGVIYRPDQLELVSARTILRSSSWNFAGRPPLEVEFARGAERLYVVVMHAKASGGFPDWQRRQRGAEALADYLAEERAGDDVLVIGDYNDDLDQSIRSSSPSPYAGLAAAHFFATAALSAANVPTTVFGHLPIDHVLAGGAMADAYLDGSAEVFPADEYVDQYSRTTSDHLPVVMRFAGEPPTGGLLLNEILANEPGSDTAGEFVEIVNPTASAVDAGGFALSDSIGVRHVVPAGTSIAAGGALVIAGIPLGLDNSGETVTLTAPGGGLVDRVTYGGDLGSRDGVSMTRAVDGDVGSPMVLHDQVSALSSSPGTRSDGSPF